MSSVYLSIIIPVFNEEKNILKNLHDFFSYLNEQDYSWEMIIVNDGSQDRTLEKVLDFQKEKKDDQIKLIDHRFNRGKGFAVCDGFLHAEGKYRLFIDADGATSIDHIDKIWEPLGHGYDIVIGTRSSRDVDGARQEIKQSFWKRFLGVCGNRVIQILTVKDVWDTQCGFKVLSEDAVKKIIPLITIDRWGFDVEILVLAQMFGFKIAKVPVVWKNSSESRVGITGYFSSLIDVFKIKWNLIRGNYKRS